MKGHSLLDKAKEKELSMLCLYLCLQIEKQVVNRIWRASPNIYSQKQRHVPARGVA